MNNYVRLNWLKKEEERLRTRYQNEEPGMKERILLEKLLEIIDMIDDVEYELKRYKTM